MPQFNCRMLTPQGQIIRSKVEESSRLACIRRLRKNGFTPISVTPIVNLVSRKPTEKAKKQAKNFKASVNFENRFNQRKQNKDKKTQGGFLEILNNDLGLGGGGKKPSSRDIRVFTQNFYLLKKANFNNIHALNTVIQTTENPRLRIILEDILVGVEGGEYMYTTMEYYSNIFPFIYINMIKVGELSGSLEQSLEQAVEYLENSDKLRKRVRKIVIPNLLMFFGLIIGTILAVLFGVPMLKNIFESVGSQKELPKVTMWLYNTTMVIKQFWYIPVGVICLIAGLFYTWLSTPKGTNIQCQFLVS